MVEIHIYGKLRKHAEEFTPAGKITQTLEPDSCDTSNPVDPDRDSASRDKSRFLKFETAVFSQQVCTDVLSPTGRPERS